MPIYEYQCGACGYQMELLQSANEPALEKCPVCGRLQMRKLISAAGFRLSGSGWYETDFKSGSKRNLSGETSSDAKKSDGGEKPGGEKKADKPSAGTAIKPANEKVT